MTISLAEAAHAPLSIARPDANAYQNNPLFAVPAAPLLEYHDRDRNVPEAVLLKTIGSFVLGVMVMGVMLNVARSGLLHFLDATPVSDFALIAHTLFLFGMGFVGSSLLLVVLKAREEWSTHLLHARHPVLAMASGAGYAAAVFGPALGAVSIFDVNFVSTLVWMLLLTYPVMAAFWMVVQQKGPRPTQA